MALVDSTSSLFKSRDYQEASSLFKSRDYQEARQRGGDVLSAGRRAGRAGCLEFCIAEAVKEQQTRAWTLLQDLQRRSAAPLPPVLTGHASSLLPY
jgi:hypothetical protein